MVAGQPLGEEVEATPPALRTDLRAPGGPAFDDSPETQAPDDLAVRRILQQPDRCPIPVQPAEGHLPFQQTLERLLIDVVVPDVGQPAHDPIIKQQARTPAGMRAWYTEFDGGLAYTAMLRSTGRSAASISTWEMSTLSRSSSM